MSSSNKQSAKQSGVGQTGKRALLMASTAMAIFYGVSAAHAQSSGGATPATNAAQAERRAFNIPAQSLSAAVGAFGRQSGLQVTLASPASGSVRTNAVTGSLTVQEALTQLLGGTGITFRFAGNGRSVVIGADQAAADVPSADGSTMLETITITGKSGRNAASGAGYQGTPDWVYETPASVSVVSREAIQSDLGARDVRDLFDNVAGTYVNNSVANSPAVSPNVRGVQDMGRVVLSVDGARQNANRTISAGGDSYIGSSGKGYVETSFIRAVEVERLTGAKSGLAGSLAGAVTFRTVGADDIISDGKDWGVEIDTTVGTNNQHFNGSILASKRMGDSPFSITGGFARQKLGNYKIGSHGDIEWDGDEDGEVTFMQRDNMSSLLKLEGDFGDVTTGVAWTHQKKDFAWFMGGLSDEEATVNTVTANLDWNPVDNDLIDFRSTFWLNDTMEETLRHTRGGAAGYPDTLISADFMSFGINIDNTSRFETAIGPATLNYGVEAFRDHGNSSASSTSIDVWPELASNFTSFSPAGRRDMASLFVNGDIEPTDWVKLSAGLRYDWYRLKGSPKYYDYRDRVNYIASAVTTEYDYVATYDPARFASANAVLRNIWSTRQGEIYNGQFYRAGTTIAALSTLAGYPENTVNIDRSGGALLPSLTVEFTPVEWLRPYVSYSKSYRPPTVTEAFFAGDLPKDVSPLSVYAPNESLRPETAETWEIGANINFDGVFTEDDTLRLKVSAFNRKIDDLIVIGYFYPYAGSRQLQSYVNTTDATRMRGVELEGNYDTGRFWVGGSATWLDAEWAQKVPSTWYGQTVSSDNVQMYSSVGVPPKLKATLDAGVRFLDNKLAIGGRVTHSTPTLSQVKTFNPDGGYTSNKYTKLDLYGSYQFNDRTTLRLSIDNVTDINHVPAGSRYPSPGRTFFASLNVRL
jgi:hemoglobin/transferrin/lactoferrin receptor protein